MPRASRDERSASAPAWAVFVACCAAMIAAYVLGMDWLGQPVFGVPTGLWLAALIFTLVEVRKHQRTGGWPSDSVIRLMAECLTRGSALAVGAVRYAWGRTIDRDPLSGRTDAIEAVLSSWHDRAPWLNRPLRIALDLPPDEAAAIVGSVGSVPTEWLRLMPSSQDPEDANALCLKHHLDAVVFRTPRGGLRIVTTRAFGRDATLRDWSFSSPMTFGTLFPHSIDPAIVEIDPGDNPPEIVCALIEAAAWTARSSHRLTLADRCFGRRPVRRGDSAGSVRVRRMDDHDDAGARLFGRLASLSGARGSRPGPAGRIAAQAAGAWIAADPLQRDARYVKWHEQICAAMPNDPASHLRLAAACFAAMDDESGIESLKHALLTLVRSEHVAGAGNHTAFVEAELMHGLDDAATLGRVAAGVCLICAATPGDRLPFLKEDMLEETRYADWLIGRDAEARVLQQVFRELERARRELDGDPESLRLAG